MIAGRRQRLLTLHEAPCTQTRCQRERRSQLAPRARPPPARAPERQRARGGEIMADASDADLDYLDEYDPDRGIPFSTHLVAGAAPASPTPPSSPWIR